jgi:hypothetical protein
VDWDQKASATIHTKNSKGPKIPPKGPFLTFCMGDCEGPCDQCHIATMTSPPLLQRQFCWINANRRDDLMYHKPKQAQFIKKNAYRVKARVPVFPLSFSSWKYIVLWRHAMVV